MFTRIIRLTNELPCTIKTRDRYDFIVIRWRHFRIFGLLRQLCVSFGWKLRQSVVVFPPVSQKIERSVTVKFKAKTCRHKNAKGKIEWTGRLCNMAAANIATNRLCSMTVYKNKTLETIRRLYRDNLIGAVYRKKLNLLCKEGYEKP